MGHAVAQSVEALHYKPEGHGFDTRWCHWNFPWHNTSGRTMALGLTQPLTQMSIRNISWGVKEAGTYGWQPYHLHVPTVMKSGSLNLLKPSGPVQSRNGTALHLLQYHSDKCSICQTSVHSLIDSLIHLTIHPSVPRCHSVTNSWNSMMTTWKCDICRICMAVTIKF